MSDQSNVATQVAPDDENVEFSLDSVERRYFGPEQLQDAQEYLNKVASIPDVAIKRNFDPSETFPDGYGIAVVPISQRVEGKGNVNIGVAVAAMPDAGLIAQHDKGSEFIRETVTQFCMSKIANSVRPRQDGTTAATMPFSIEDFIESRRGRESLKAFTEIAPTFVKALRKKGIKFMTPAILRQTLQSSAFAESQFENVPQEKWVKVLDTMIEHAKAKQLDPAVLVNWKETRDQAEAVEVEDLDLEDLDELVGATEAA